MKVSEGELFEAMDTEFDGIELIIAVEELLNLRKRVKELEEELKAKGK